MQIPDIHHAAVVAEAIASDFEQRQSFWPLLPHQKMLPSFSRLLIDAHRSDVNRSLLI